MASGDTLLTFSPSAAILPSSNYAQFDIRNSHLVLDYDGATNESIILQDVMPQHYDGGGYEVRLWTTSDGTTGDMDWDAAFERLAADDQDIDSDGFAAANSTDNTNVDSTSGQITIVTITFTDGADADSVTAGDAFRLQITRDAASDTSTSDCQLLRVEIQEA